MEQVDNAISETRLSSTRKEIQAFDLNLDSLIRMNLDSLTKERYERYENLQAKFVKDITVLFAFLKNYPSAAQMTNDFAAMLPKMESNIEKAKAEFVLRIFGAKIFLWTNNFNL